MKLIVLVSLMVIYHVAIILATTTSPPPIQRGNEKRQAHFKKMLNVRTDGKIASAVTVQSLIECGVKCLGNVECKGANFCSIKNTDNFKCELLSQPGAVWQDPNCSYLKVSTSR